MVTTSLVIEYINKDSVTDKFLFLREKMGLEQLQILIFNQKKALPFMPNDLVFSISRPKETDYSISDFQTISNLTFHKLYPDAPKKIILKNINFLLPVKLESKSFGSFLIPTNNLNEDQKNLLILLKKQIEQEVTKNKLSINFERCSKELSFRHLEIESLIDVTNIVNDNTNELEQLFENLLITILSSLNSSKGMILLRDSKTNFFNVISKFNLTQEDLPKKIIRISKGIIKELDDHKKAIIVDDPHNYSLLSFSNKNVLISPLTNQDKLVGAIILVDKESRSGLVKFTLQDLRLFDILSKKVSLAYDNLRLIESLQNSNKLVDNIMSSITTGIIKINFLGELEYINQSAKKIFAMQEDEVLNNHYFVVFQNNPQLITLLEKAEQEPQSILQEDKFEIETFQGSPGQINLTLSTVFDENQLPSGIIFSFEDLSSINKVTSTFKKYVSENIVDELLKNDTLMELGGVQNDVCVLFCDIRGFTSMSEKMKPNEVVYLLNNYFEAMIEVVFKFNGTLDKIIGDELMVLYGVPIKTDNDAQSAVNSALEMMATLRRFNNEMESKGYPKLQIGIGVNAGQVVCGNIGSKRQMNYTVIGDPVNLAARLCSHAKPGEIVISKSVFEQLNDSVGFEEKTPIFVKGKKAQIQNWIYKATD